METTITKKYRVSQEEFKEIVYKKILPNIPSFQESINILINEIKELAKLEQIIYFPKQDLFLDTKMKILLPNLDNYKKISSKVNLLSVDGFLEKNPLIENLPCELPTYGQIQGLQATIRSMDNIDNFFLCICDDKRRNECGEYIGYNLNQGIIKRNEEGLATCIFPISKISYSSIDELTITYLLTYGMCPKGLSKDSTICFDNIILLYEYCKEFFEINEKYELVFTGGRVLVDRFFANPNDDLFANVKLDFIEVLKQYYDKKCVGEIEMEVGKDLLNCEKIRADIDPYEERLLTDPNRGHWDLWMEGNESSYTVEISENMVARNPLCDINENGVIAIDFGTKSTIVVYQSDIEHSLPMGVGDGNLSKGPSAKRYENPTVMHFVDLESFLHAYDSQKGRPSTKWEDLTISHTAMDQFSNSKSEEYYEYLHKIKQWAGQREKQFRVQSHSGKTYVLPAFLDVDDDLWNPIEIYAYYIGLYINNMRKGHGIFLDYYLSFPVTYETKIREKIIRSFEKGLKKSLPVTVLNNEEAMKRFSVHGDISEPAAYAVCALQEYGFEPEDDDEVFYGIFDFGGGTTDFDFGLWKASKKRRYDYTIENFGAGGDEFLGGENLLEMLAFEVFKENQALMREKGYTFTLAPKCTEFLGSDALLADSQEAEKNMHNLMEKIRPYWEIKDVEEESHESIYDRVLYQIRKAIKEYEIEDEIETELEEQIEDIEQEVGVSKLCEYSYDEVIGALWNIIEEINEYDSTFEEWLEDEVNANKGINDQIKFVVNLFDKNGEDHVNETLHFSKTKLDNLIEKRIQEGINNFFSALLLSYQSEKVKKPTTVNILLAGNSCKSPVVKYLFKKAIEEQEMQIKKKYNISQDIGNLFEIFPPLGTEDAYQKMEERGLNVNRDDFERPTGKTGVAFGLIQCRAGGVIERISNIGIDEEIPFQYFLGWRSKKKFVVFKDDSKVTKYRGKPDYNEWYKFIEADEAVFDLYYTSLPECVRGELIVDGNAAVKRLRCEIDIVDESAYVYIRAIDPHTLEYVVAKNDNVENSKLGKIVRKEL